MVCLWCFSLRGLCGEVWFTPDLDFHYFCAALAAKLNMISIIRVETARAGYSAVEYAECVY